MVAGSWSSNAVGAATGPQPGTTWSKQPCLCRGRDCFEPVETGGCSPVRSADHRIAHFWCKAPFSKLCWLKTYTRLTYKAGQGGSYHRVSFRARNARPGLERCLYHEHPRQTHHSRSCRSNCLHAVISGRWPVGDHPAPVAGRLLLLDRYRDTARYPPPDAWHARSTVDRSVSAHSHRRRPFRGHQSVSGW